MSNLIAAFTVLLIFTLLILAVEVWGDKFRPKH